MNTKIVCAGLLGLLAMLQYALWFGDKNMLDLYRLRQSVEQVRQQNETLLRRNEKLLAEVVDLKNGGPTIETLARSEFGLIKPNETFYQVIE